MHGQFTWYELLTSDPTGAQRFYPAVTGWGVQDWDQATADNPYRMWTAGGVPMAGLMPLTSEQRAMGAVPSWMAYIDVDNAQETVRKATQLGAKVLFGPGSAPGVGTFAGLADPEGAVFAILQPERRSPGFDGVPKAGRFSWHELLTTDMDAAWNFYSQLFNWKKMDAMDMGEAGRYQMYGQNGRMYGGMFNRSGRMANVAPAWFCYVNVPDAQRARDAAVRAGARVIFDIMEVPGGDKVAMFADPQGAMFAVHQVSAASAKAKAGTAKKAAKKSARKAAKKSAKRSAKKPSRKTATKSSRRSAAKSRKRAGARKKARARRGARRKR